MKREGGEAFLFLLALFLSVWDWETKSWPLTFHVASHHWASPPASEMISSGYMARDQGHSASSVSCVACSAFSRSMGEAAGSGCAWVCHLSFWPAHNIQYPSNVSTHFAQPSLKLKAFKDYFVFVNYGGGVRWCAHVSSGACRAP